MGKRILPVGRERRSPTFEPAPEFAVPVGFVAIVEPAPPTGTDELSDTSSPHSNDNLEFSPKSNLAKSSPGTTHAPGEDNTHSQDKEEEEDGGHGAEPPDDEEEEEDDYEGEPPDNKGWHVFPIHPKSKKATIYVAHNGDFEWLKSLNGKFPPGFAPQRVICGVIRGMSFCGSNLLPISSLGVHEDGKPLYSGTQSADEQMMELMLGKPTIVGPRGYNPANHRIAMLLGIGPDRLDIHITYSDLPRILDVYDEDDVTNPLSERTDNDSGPAGVMFDRLDQKKCLRLSKSPC
ncbi:hypothetical protein BU17DRAFT_100970 [Hysterangium stoloniferum]|nr:hypothetical protein BU17DRAFT_100970 [Hysterangium stoloniferum]